MFLIMFFLSISMKVLSPAEKCLYVERLEPINPYETIFKAICFVESSNRAYIINQKEQAYGLCQIREARLSDFNRETGANYTLADCLRENVSKIVFMHNATKFDYWNYELIAKDWNKSVTDKYYLKVKKQLDDKQRAI